MPHYSIKETGDLRIHKILADGFVALQDRYERKLYFGMRIREGLESLEKYLIGLGDELGEGAGRWIVSQQIWNNRRE
jgi:hypothetical protein